MNFIRAGIDPDPKTVEVRFRALLAQGHVPGRGELSGLTESQVRHHIDPCNSGELFSLCGMKAEWASVMSQFLPESMRQKLNGHANGEAKALESRVARAEPFFNGQPNGEAKTKHFELIPFGKIAIDTTPAYLVKGIIPRVGLCVFWGPPKCGKSFLVFDLAMHIALGWDYRDRKARQGAVVYCALEGCSAFKNRVEAFRQAKLAKNASEVPFHLMAAPMTLVADQVGLIASMREQAGAPAAVVIDTLNRSLAGSESSDEDMAAYIKAADAIRDAFNCAVIIVHHCGHEGTRPRGHSSLMGALDAQVAVTRDAADKIIATVELMKDGPQGDCFSSRLKKVELGTDDDGDTISSCVVEAAEGFAARAAKAVQLPAGATKALRALHEILDDAGIIAPADAHTPHGLKVVTIEAWKEHSFKRGLCADGDRKLKWITFKRAFDRLTVANKVAVSGDFVWPIVQV